jgi:release factor glutamine methyltransferase
MTTIHQALHDATTRLTAASSSPRLDAEVLLAHVLSMSRARLIAERDQPLDADMIARYESLVRRRESAEPVAYLIGHKEFWGLDFFVDQRVLVPRPETELIIERALAWVKERGSPPAIIADIGTGSGCLAVTLAIQFPEARVWAVDLSADALEVAQINVARHGVGDRVRLLHGDGFGPLAPPIDLIVSNPPYTILDEVDENVRRWEPHLALDGGHGDGFAIPARLITEAPHYLATGGALLMEIAAWQGAAALDAARESFPHAAIAVHRDLAGLDRVLEIIT